MVHPRRGADDDLDSRRPRSTTAFGAMSPLCGSAKLLALAITLSMGVTFDG
jgi:hypothetical protein